MPLDERKARWTALVRSVREENVERWTENFMADLAAVESAEEPVAA